METVQSTEGEYQIIPETMQDPQYLVAETDSVQDAHEDGGDATEDEDGIEQIRDQDRFLPIANVAKIMKNSIPENAKIAKDAKECVQECVSEFVSFITSEASDRCQQEKRKTINGEDLLFAMSTLGFDSYVEPLKVFLSKYRESIKGEKSGTRRRDSFEEEEEERLVTMETNSENVGASVAAFVTTSGQSINIIPGPTSGQHQELIPQHQQITSQIYTAAYPSQSDMPQVHFQS